MTVCFYTNIFMISIKATKLNISHKKGNLDKFNFTKDNMIKYFSIEVNNLRISLTANVRASEYDNPASM